MVVVEPQHGRLLQRLVAELQPGKMAHAPRILTTAAAPPTGVEIALQPGKPLAAVRRLLMEDLVQAPTHSRPVRRHLHLVVAIPGVPKRPGTPAPPRTSLGMPEAAVEVVGDQMHMMLLHLVRMFRLLRLEA